MGVRRRRLPGHRLREGGLGRRRIPLPEVEGRERELELRSVFEVSPCCLEATKRSAHFLGRPRRPGHQEEGLEVLRVRSDRITEPVLGCLRLPRLKKLQSLFIQLYRDAGAILAVTRCRGQPSSWRTSFDNTATPTAPRTPCRANNCASCERLKSAAPPRSAAMWKDVASVRTSASRTTPAATGIARSVRTTSGPSGWSAAKPNCCRSSIST